MLHAVLHAIEQARGPVLLSDLSRDLGIDSGVLQELLQFWVRKGRLKLDGVDGAAPSSTHTACGGGCHDASPGACVFIAKMPTTYTIAPRPRQ